MTTRARREAAWVVLATSIAMGSVLAVRVLQSRGDFASRDFEFVAPEALLLVGVVPWVLLGALRSRAELSRAGRFVALAVRAALLVVLVVALARPAWRVDATRTSTVVLVDVSASVPEEAIARAREAIVGLLEARARRAQDEPHVEVVAFAAIPRRLPLPERPEDFVLARIDDVDGALSSRTDLASAMRFAAGLFSPGRAMRFWILSDGLETHGRALAQMPSLRARGVRIAATPLEGPIAPNLSVRGISFPDEIRAGQPFEVRVSVRSTRPTRARVRLLQNGRIVGLDGTREVDLAPGDAEVAFRTVARERGVLELRAEIEPIEASSDRFAADDRFVRAAHVVGRPRVLVVGLEPSRLEAFARVLEAAEMDVELRGPRGLPSSSSSLADFEALVLADVPADQVSPSVEAAIDGYVRRGGVFLFAGGPRSYGPGGWRGTQTERLLPVALDGERRRDTPSLALALVIDRSGSMAGDKIELAKEAARATAEVLSPDDSIAVIGFDSVAERIVPLQSAANRLAIQRDIGRLAPRGGTAIFPALDAAYRDLSSARAATRHVILLTDGQTNEPGIPQLVSAMRFDGITVSAVGVGTDVNRTLLSEIADLGGGRAYFTTDPSSIPRIFLREASTVGQNAFVEEPTRMEPATSSRAFRGIDFDRAPFLRGYVSTRMRPAPSEMLLRSESGEPLLARRPVGEGTTLAWTSDLAARWSAELLRWPLAPRLFGQVLREHTRSDETSFLPLSAVIEDDRLILSADAFGEDDTFLRDVSVRARIEGPLDAPEPERQRLEVELGVVAPGRLEAEVPLARYGAYAVEAVHSVAGVPYGSSRASPSHPYPAEYARLEPDIALLEALAAGSLGLVRDPDPQLFLDHDESERIEAHRKVTPWVVGVALALLVLDVFVRRTMRA